MTNKLIISPNIDEKLVSKSNENLPLLNIGPDTMNSGDQHLLMLCTV
jgi:hypothetical protein